MRPEERGTNYLKTDKVNNAESCSIMADFVQLSLKRAAGYCLRYHGRLAGEFGCFSTNPFMFL